MQDDRIKDFDLKIKAMLEDAQEEVPAGVWSALEGRISSPRRVVFTWRRAMTGFAAAAAIAMAVLIPSHLGHKENIVIADKVNTYTEPQEIVSIEEQIGQSQAILADLPSNSTINTNIGRVPAEITSPSAFESLPIEEDPSDAGEFQSQEGSQPVLSDSRATEQKAEKNDSDTMWTDPWAEIEEEHNTSLRDRFSFSVQGNLADNDRSGKASAPSRSPSVNSIVKTGVIDKSQSSHGVPVTFGLGVRFKLNDKFSVGSGINYSRLSRSFTGMYNKVEEDGFVSKSITTDIYNELHYIGIPVNLYYQLMNSGNLSFFVYGGGSLEKGLANNFRIKSEPKWIDYNQSVPGVQLSAAVGLSMEFNLFRGLSLYLDPGLRYYFDCDQPKSIRTDKPCMFNFDIGFRFNLDN